MFIPSQKKFPTNLVLGACLTQNLLLFQTRQPFPATQANQASFAGAINHHEAPRSRRGCAPSRGALNPSLNPLPKIRGLQTTRGHIVQENKAVAVLSACCEETPHAAGPFQ